MKRSAIVVVALSFAAVLVMTSACSSDADDADDECCPISDVPTCSDFLLGGAKSLQPDGTCGPGIPDTTQPTKSVDAKGCPVWLLTGPGRCGAAPSPLDSGVDAADAADEDRYAPPLEQDAESP